MTQFEQFEIMLNSADIQYSIENEDKYHSKYVECKVPVTIITIERGYWGFVSDIVFNSETGDLITIEAYE